MKLETLFSKLLEFQSNLKLFHFQTQNYGAHLASDKLYVKVVAQLDVIMEVYQGVLGKRIPRMNTPVRVKTLSDTAMKTYASEFVNFLSSAQKSISCVKHSQMCSEIDVLKKDVDTFIYLLSFK